MPGVWRAAAYCSGAAVIFHSPRACAHVARSMDISAQYRALANGAAENLKPIKYAAGKTFYFWWCRSFACLH